MANVIAVTDAIQTLADVESRFGLQQSDDVEFFTEWTQSLPALTITEQDGVKTIARRLSYHRAHGELLEGTVTILAAAPLLELAGFYDPPFQLRAEATVEISVQDSEETLRGRIDVLIIQNQLWMMILESKKTTISLRSALPQILAYMMATPQANSPIYGVLTNGDDVLFVKLNQQPQPRYALSRAFSIYTQASELTSTVQILKRLGQQLVA
ncbi:MAG: type I restriction endonuclease [Cyanobacteria bacterium P01_C01_bin.120]